MKEFIESKFDESVVPSLMEYVRIDNLSRTYDPEWMSNGKLEKAAGHIQEWVRGLGIEGLSCEVIKD